MESLLRELEQLYYIWESEEFESGVPISPELASAVHQAMSRIRRFGVAWEKE